MSPKCPECGSTHLHQRDEVRSGGSKGPHLLPDLGTFWSSARITVVICADCGLVRFYGCEDARAKAMEYWAPVSSTPDPSVPPPLP